MTTLSDALGRAPNPLAAHTVSDGDSGDEWVDLTTLYAEVRHDLWQSCERGRRGRAQTLALVGEAGSGKSHILQWLRQQVAVRSDPNRYLITMPALPDLAQPFRHTLRQLVGALCKRDLAAVVQDASDPVADQLLRPIDRLLWEALFLQSCDLLDAARIGMYQGPAALLKLLGPMCNDAGRKRPLASFVAAAQKVWPQVEPGLRSYLLSLPTEMSIDSAARAVFLQFPYPERRALCIAWLAGEELAQKDRERLSAKQVINNENAAKHVLCSVVRLLTAASGAQLLLVYDQTQQLVEQLGQPGVQAMAEVAAAIQASGGTCLQVLSLRPATYDQFQERPTRGAPGPGRQVDKTLQLGRPGAEQLRELVATRLAVGLAEIDERPSSIYPLSEADLDPNTWPKDADTPRGALLIFAERYAQRRREVAPGSGGSGRNAVSSPDQRRTTGSMPGRSKNGPGAGKAPLASAQSPSLDFLSMEETGDAPVQAADAAGTRPRSLTHASEPDSGATTLAPKNAASARSLPSFVADSSPTIQALPKELVAAALMPTQSRTRDLAREAKLNPSFVADSSPTLQALSHNDVMGKVRGTSPAAKRPPETASKQPQTTPSGGRSSLPSAVESAAKGRGPAPRTADKPAEKPAEAAPRPIEKLTSRPASAVAASVKAILDPGATMKHKVEMTAVPSFEADSSPTLKQMPDETLIKASRDGSRPHNGPLLARITPLAAADSSPTGRATPTLQTQPALISATRPSTAPAKPVAVEKTPIAIKPATRPPATALPPTEISAPLPSNVPDPLPASADSPSMGWLAMANDQSPLADAVKQAKADLKTEAPTKPVALAEPPRQAPSSTPAAPPKGASAPPKAAVAAAPQKSSPPAAPAKAAPIPATAPAAAEAVPTELPPSAESPSMGWLAMASGSSQLDDALAAAKADKKDSGPVPAMRAPRPVRDAGGVVVVNRSTVKAPESAVEVPAEPARAPARSTQARMPAIQLRTAKSVSPQQVLLALAARGRMEEWQLAQELGIVPDALEKILAELEDEGRVRLVPIEDGQRTVVLLD